ncbi:MAG: hypothetical protein GY870_18400 [archaeon]|nr:hypothetical protein [archaeon]
MEFIFGVIEDLLERLDSSNSDDVEDAKNSLRNNKAQFIKNLEEIINGDNGPKEEVTKLIEKLKNTKLE